MNVLLIGEMFNNWPNISAVFNIIADMFQSEAYYQIELSIEICH